MATLFNIFLSVHGILHSRIWVPHLSKEGVLDPRHSWLLTYAKLPGSMITGISIILAAISGVLLILGALGSFGGISWSSSFVIGGSLTSLILLLTYFHPWFSFAVIINVWIIYFVGLQ